VKRSVDRLLTTHIGSLARPPAILRDMKARRLGLPCDQFESDVGAAIVDVVRRQADVGLDVVNDGEYARPGCHSYVYERLGGMQPRPPDPDEDVWGVLGDREQQLFPDFYTQYHAHYRYLWMPPEVPIDDVPNLPGNYERFRLVGPIRYTGQRLVQRDLQNLRSALANVRVAEAFVTAAPPMGSSKGRADRNILDFYRSEQDFLYALADALREEYTAVIAAGFLLQLELGVLNPRRHLLDNAAATTDEKNQAMELGVEIVNHALRDVPEERVRYHHCWGSSNSPHTQDDPLRAIVHPMLKIKAQAYSIEAANPRHEHEWMVWKDVKLPDGKILMPGVVSHQTSVVEHPELIAWRLTNYANLVGKENLIAAPDCGFSQYWDSIRVHPTVQWAKLEALVEGAELASRQLWGR
jgi:5-methyltetrahydropteroyltriglutamate--homocysteine methyltransferase